VDRRAFIGTLAGGLLAAPLAAEAQQAGRVPQIGYLSNGSPAESDRRTSQILRHYVRVRFVEGIPQALGGALQRWPHV